ncbi:phospholipid/cholesterol/gamma-HCH transport system substrate-binding protein [Haloechinothrix alba]|uniref:Phospholipid/cholesterol/gamma-HCH transport system substrate-binding protein n=1 Tax=Haloechinothrix alba TaxID=664784 RepID=A0A238ZZU2_9PSEU|nr:MlaD family protein [Haloechinothrix alba]SNR88672.1 phospholipid/cholesterol/gamma-HCH transport system substrate-binding protein [Haloechinothrix alba]
MRRVARERRGSLALGTVAILLLVGSAFFAVNAQHGMPGTTELSVRAAFSDVGSLRVGDDVRISGVRVGRVAGVELGDERALVDLALTDVDTVYRNAEAVTASVGARSALGQRYVSLNPGTPEAGELGEDEVLEAAETAGAQELTGLFDVFDEPTRDALGSSLREVGGGMAGHSTDVHDALQALPEALPDIAAISRALTADGGSDTVAMLSAADSLSARFAENHRQLADLTSQLDETLASMAVDKGQPLARTLERAPGTMREARTALSSLDGPLADTESAMAALRPGATALAEATPDVRGVLRESRQPLGTLPGVAEQAEPAVEDLTGVFADARPVAPQLTSAVSDLRDPLQVLEPYAPQIPGFFSSLSRLLSDGDQNGNWLRFALVGATETATGTADWLSEDPTVARDPYPAPGEADVRKQSVLPGQGE